jgi:hypothetical protein
MEKEFQELLRKEGIVRNEPAMWIKSEDNTVHGRLILTTKRLFFARTSTNNVSFNRNMLSDPQMEPVLEIDLDTINAISQETYVVDTNVLSLTYLQYETVKLSVIHYEDWEKDIQSTRMIPDIPGDPNKAAEEAA